MFEDIRVRIAPSPTGKLHIGTARTALFNYLFAKKNGGTFILRIEDTDKERSDEIFSKDIFEGLKWLGLNWNEGPEKDGGVGPYFQQERIKIYNDYLDKLFEDDKVYKCFCTVEDLDNAREAAKSKGQAYRYDGRCRHLTGQEIEANEQAGKPYTVRLKVEPEVIEFTDLLHGKMAFHGEDIGDFIIVRSDETPVFLYTSVLDDALMKISHVLRGDDHLANTAKQLLILEALGFDKPQYGHFPLIFNKDRSKMSKRKDPVSITADFRDKGYLPEALINFIALLGWSSGTDQEIFDETELIRQFDLDKIGKSPSIFDIEKLNWMNGLYIRHLPIEELGKRVIPFVKDAKLKEKIEGDMQFFYKALKLIQERMKTLDEIDELIGFFFDLPKYDSKLLVAKKSSADKTLVALGATLETIGGIDDLSVKNSEPLLRELAAQNKLKDGELLWAVRVALSGLEASPGTFELIEAFGKDETAKRLKSAIKKLG